MSAKHNSAPPPPPVFTREQAAALLAAPNIKTRRGLRHRVVMELMYRAGLRVSEVVNLRLEDVDFAQEMLFIRASKRGKHRNVPISSALLPWLEAWRGQRDVDVPWYLYSDNAQQLRIRSIYDTIKLLGARVVQDHPELGLRLQDVHPHTFRHTCATEALEAGGNLMEVKDLLGHSSVACTQIYTHVRPQKLRSLVDRMAAGEGA